ncbi:MULTISPECIES: MFS transporter [Frankia]|uniref:Antibiotic antiporter n=1 Tax=Frankia alni (strain DSM 45986 / CECT 9034 / ACN14a) TaxID=326424 RepID=Q0RT10_FRAAA|nr:MULTISPECIES: MFS transporter [Frankia]CAJ59293.1 putative antibiotic antiporter [Frankia alni ACN14a]
MDSQSAPALRLPPPAVAEWAEETAGRDDAFVWTNRHTVALLVLCLAQLLEALDMTVVNVALPAVRDDLGFSAGNLAWVVNAYTVLFGGFLLLGGRAGDLLGRRRVFLTGMLAFTVASLGAGLSQGETSLISARAVQGLAAGFVSPMTLAMIASIFPQGPPRNRALGVWGTTSALSASLGLILGGVLVDGPGWRWIFFINLPVAAVLLVSALRVLPPDRPTHRHQRFDAVGAVASTIGASLLAYTVIQTDAHGWGSARTISLFALTVVVIAYFIVHETKISKEPLVPFSLFRIRSLSAANTVQALTSAAMFALFFFTSLYMQNVLHYSSLKTGLAYLPLTATLVIFAGIVPPLIPKLGVRWVLVAGATVSAVGLALFSRITPERGLVSGIILPSLVVSFGFSLMWIPMTIAAVSGVPGHQNGIAAAMLNVSRTLGGALGLAFISTFATRHTASLLARHDPPRLEHALSDGYRLGFLISAALMVATAVTALTLFRNEGRGEKVDTAQLAAVGIEE